MNGLANNRQQHLGLLSAVDNYLANALGGLLAPNAQLSRFTDAVGSQILGSSSHPDTYRAMGIESTMTPQDGFRSLLEQIPMMTMGLLHYPGKQ